MSKKHINWVTAILSFVILAALLSAFTPVQAFNTVNDNALQETPVVTVIVPTVVIPDTGDGNQANAGFFMSLFFWGILILVLFVLLALIVGRSSSVTTERTVTTEHHDHYDDR
jgi:hypothetical protein